MQTTFPIILFQFLLFLLLLANSVNSGPFFSSSSSSSECSEDNSSSEDGPQFPPSNLDEESRTLDQLYQAALKEGSRLIVYAGGDTPGQQDGNKAAFERRFPGIQLDIIVDYSKFHAPRIDFQLANNSLVPDVVQIQTVQDFPRWKAQGVLMQYKPRGWSAIFRDYRDEDAFYSGIFVDAFSNVVNTQRMPNSSEWPREAADYLRPEFGNGKLVATYPTDDDAVLFWFKQIVDKFGWQWVARFAGQQPIYVRGTQAPADMVEAGTALATMTTDGALVPANGTASRFVLPAKGDPIVIWAQQAAIFKQAKRPAAAKLYLNWILDKETQTNVWYMWSVRRDVPPPKGYRQSWEYPNSSHKKFAAFMADREAVERFRAQISLYLGEAQGPPSPGQLGMFPEKALPH